MPYPCPCVSFTGSIPCLFRILIYTHFIFFFVSYTVCISCPFRAPFRYRRLFSSYTILYSFLNRILPYLRRPVSFLRIFYCIPLFIFSYRNIYAGIFLFVYFIVRTYGWFYVLALRRESCFSLFFSYIFLYVFLYLLRILYWMFPDRTYMVTGPGIFPSFFVYRSGFSISFFVSYTVSYCLFFRILYRMFSSVFSFSFAGWVCISVVWMKYGTAGLIPEGYGWRTEEEKKDSLFFFILFFFFRFCFFRVLRMMAYSFCVSVTLAEGDDDGFWSFVFPLFFTG